MQREAAGGDRVDAVAMSLKVHGTEIDALSKLCRGESRPTRGSLRLKVQMPFDAQSESSETELKFTLGAGALESLADRKSVV